MQEAILLLADGTVYKGKPCGKIGTTVGELCFATSMTGYQELFTDPSYHGQLLISTNVHVGNYGVKSSDQEADNIHIEGLICREFNTNFSRKQAEGSLQDYFISQNLVGVSNIDTRAVVRHIRHSGAMNAILSSEINDIDVLTSQLRSLPNMSGLELSSKVTTEKPYFYGNENAKYKIAVLDLGVKRSILKNFEVRDVFMQVFPAKTSFEDMQAWNPDAYFISNGPGDPSAMNYAVDTVQKILAADIPLFGICLGHQILARAVGLPTYKMHNGHRGSNHPVKNLITDKNEISTQNHGFAVDIDALKKSEKAILTHINLNDNTVEGISIVGKKAFSVQYHPEASPGPHDSRYLFDDFISIIEKNTK
jgi:carbamoyl-phosphate synthase small subunit